MTSIPLPTDRKRAKKEGELRRCVYGAEIQQQRYYERSDPRMSGFQSLLSYFTKKSKKAAVEKASANESDQEIKKAEEESCEGSEEEAKDDIAFVRSTFRQSVKRAIGWRKSQRKAVNKRKKENIQNSKLLTGGDPSPHDRDDTDNEYYEDSELDVVVETDGPDVPSASCRTPKRRQSTKRPAVSIKSSGFFSQSVATKRTAESGIPVKARNNKASALREEATKKKLESSPAPNSATPGQEIEMIPMPTATPARRKPRASFRTKKGISRKPLAKKQIQPAENKASRLRTKKLQENSAEDEMKQKGETRQADQRRSDRFSSVGVKTPGHSIETRDPLAHSSYSKREPGSKPRNAHSDSRTKSNKEETPAGKIPGRVTKTAPPKPLRSKIPMTNTALPSSPSANSLSSNIPTASSSVPSRKLATPPTLSLANRSQSDESRKYSGISQKSSPTNIPKPNFNPIYEPSSDLTFVPLDSTSLPLSLSGEKRTKIDDVTRKRKINRPISNIFEGGAGDLPTSRTRQYDPLNEGEMKFTVHVTKTPAGNPRASTSSKTPGSATPKTKRTMPKTPISSSPKTPISSSPKTPISSSPKTPSSSCTNKRTKPKQIQNLSNFERRGSLDSSKRSKKSIKILSSKPILLSDSNYCNSDGSDLENSYSFGSNKSYEKDNMFDDDLLEPSVFNDPGSPILCESPRLRTPKLRLSSITISIDELETQKHNLRTPRGRAGSIRVNNIRTRRSWLRSDCDILDVELQKEKTSLNEELLLLEDLTSGHSDVTQTLASRTLVIKNVLSQLRRGDYERSARLIQSLCFPRSHPDEEFKTMRRACQCTADDLALFQNCLGVLLLDRSSVNLPVISTLIGKLRYTFEVLGTDVLRGSIGDMLKHITSNFGHKIAQRNSKPGMNFRLREHAEECYTELSKIKIHVARLSNSSDQSADLMALKKTLELFDF